MRSTELCTPNGVQKHIKSALKWNFVTVTLYRIGRKSYSLKICLHPVRGAQLGRKSDPKRSLRTPLGVRTWILFTIKGLFDGDGGGKKG